MLKFLSQFIKLIQGRSYRFQNWFVSKFCGPLCSRNCYSRGELLEYFLTINCTVEVLIINSLFRQLRSHMHVYLDYIVHRLGGCKCFSGHQLPKISLNEIREVLLWYMFFFSLVYSLNHKFWTSVSANATKKPTNIVAFQPRISKPATNINY